MGQPSASSGGGGGGSGSCQVRCAGCHWILTVAQGMTEFSCPKCQLPQMLPPEMMILMRPQVPQGHHQPPSAPLPPQLPPPLPLPLQLSSSSSAPSLSSSSSSQAPALGIDPTKIQLPCARCKAILNVPHGLSRFSCPQCGVDLAVDLSKLHHFFPNPPSINPPPPPEEINEVTFFLFFFFF